MRPDAESPSAADTLSERAATRVEADILSGALAPDSRLGIAETAARYGVGATPARSGERSNVIRARLSCSWMNASASRKVAIIKRR